MPRVKTAAATTALSHAKGSTRKSIITGPKADDVPKKNSIHFPEKEKSYRTYRDADDVVRKVYIVRREKTMEWSVKRKRKRRCRLPGRKRTRRYYESDTIQISVAFLIFLNFIVACVKAQIVPPKHSTSYNIFRNFDHSFSIIFAIELLFNMYGSWFRRFWKSAWNVFDFIIVSVSLMSMVMDGIPGITVLRLFRAFRVFRLFKRVESLRIIIEGIIASLVGVFYAFCILFFLMGVWSIMGVNMYHEFSDQYFGNWIKGMFTLWQVMSMDSWCSNIARSITFTHNNTLTHDRPYASLYFISFLILGGILMTNVVVAILLERYLETVKKEENKVEIRHDNIKCYTNKREWKQIPKEEQKHYEYHKPIEKKELDVLESMSKEEYIEMFRDVEFSGSLDRVNVDEMRHLMKILWCDYGEKQWMAKIIERHSREEWVDEEVQPPSYLLYTLFKNIRDQPRISYVDTKTSRMSQLSRMDSRISSLDGVGQRHSRHSSMH